MSVPPRTRRWWATATLAVLASVAVAGCVPLPSQIPFLPQPNQNPIVPQTPTMPTQPGTPTTPPSTNQDWLNEVLDYPTDVTNPAPVTVGPLGVGPLWAGNPLLTPNNITPDEPANVIIEPTVGTPIVASGIAWPDSSQGLIFDAPGPTATGGNLLETTVGKLFVTYQDNSWTCTATVINSATNNILVTAAHCVIDEDSGMPADSVTFHPGYSGSDDPFGEWVAEQYYWNPDYVTSLPEPIEDEWGMYADFAFVRMAPNAQGQEIEEVTGGQGIAFGGEANGLLSIGYAAASPYNGRFPRACADNAPEFGTSYFPHLILHCQLTGGASGGPILTNVDPATGAGTIVAVNSFGGSTTLGGPPLGATALGLLQQAEAEGS